MIEEITVKKTLKYKDSPILNLNVKYPEFIIKDNIKAEKFINHFYKDIINAYIILSEKKIYKKSLDIFLSGDAERKFKPFGSSVSYKVTCQKDSLISLYIDFTVYNGIGRGNILRKAQIWDLTVPGLLRFDDLCKINRKKIFSQLNGEYDIDSDKLKKYFDFDNFYLTDKYYIFFFPQGTVCHPDHGIVTVRMPPSQH